MTDRELADMLDEMRLASKQLPQTWEREYVARQLEVAMRENAKQIIRALRRDSAGAP